MITEKSFIVPFIMFIDKVTGEKAYPGDENVTIPSGDYMSLTLEEFESMSTRPVAKDYDAEVGAPVTFNSYEAVVRLNGYGDSALGWLQSISHAFGVESHLNTLLKNGVGYSRHTPVRNSSIPVNQTKVEKRYTMLISFSYIYGEVDPTGEAGCIETVTDTTGTYN